MKAAAPIRPFDGPAWSAEDRAKPITFATRDSLIVGEPSRPLDEKVVEEIAESILRVGVINPIVVAYVYTDNPAAPRTLVDGGHRWAAINKVWDSLPEDEARKFVMPIREIDDGSDTGREYVSLTLNLDRNDLTKAEREIAAARRALLQADIDAEADADARDAAEDEAKLDAIIAARKAASPNGRSKPEPAPKRSNVKGDTNWFTAWYTDGGIGKNTAYRRWDEFLASRGVDTAVETREAGKASKADQKAFFTFLATERHTEEGKAKLAEVKATAKPEPDPMSHWKDGTAVRVLADAFFERLKLVPQEHVLQAMAEHGWVRADVKAAA